MKNFFLFVLKMDLNMPSMKEKYCPQLFINFNLFIKGFSEFTDIIVKND